MVCTPQINHLGKLSLTKCVDSKIRDLGETFRTSWNRSFDYEPSEKMVNGGYTHEMHTKRKEEIASSEPWEYHTDLYFIWARRAQLTAGDA